MKKIIACLIVLCASYANAGQFSGESSGGFRFGSPGIVELDNFVSLEESTLYGVAGSLADLTNRIYQPRELYEPDFTSWTQNYDLQDDSCTTNGDTWTNVTSAINAAANKTVIHLPASCLVNLFMIANTGAGASYTWPVTKDEVALMCAGGGECGIMGQTSPGAGTAGSPNWDHTDSSSTTGVGGRTFQRYLIAIGGSGGEIIRQCNWIAGYGINSNMVQLDCAIDNRTTIQNPAVDIDLYMGPGDIIRLSADPNIAEAARYSFQTRVTCVQDNNGVRYPSSDPTNTLCNEITGNNQLQILDGLMMDYSPNGYHWGQNSGTAYNQYPSGTDTYRDTQGHIMQHIERVGTSRCDLVSPGVCGYGAETDNIAEDVWFVNMKWDSYPSYLTGAETRWLNSHDGGMVRNRFDMNPGYVAHHTFGGTGSTHASGTLMLSNDFYGSAGNSKCFGRIRAIRQTNPIEMDIDTEAFWLEGNPPVEVDCSFTVGDIQVGFTEDVVDSRLSGKILAKTAVSETLGTPDITTIQLIGVDGRCTGGGICVDTTLGGLAVHIDSFAGAVMYCNSNTSRIQIVDNVIRNPGQGPIVQSGCSAFTYAANFMRTDYDHRRGRGPFFHGNAGAPAALFEMNDSDQRVVYMDTSNSPNNGWQGEGHNHTWFKNRFIDSGVNTWPLGTTLGNHWGGTGEFLWANQEDQWGQSNENWNIIENVAQDIFDGNSLIDYRDNQADTAPDNELRPPYVLKNLAFFRNRSYGAGINMDDNFETTTGNPTTLTDVLGRTGGANLAGTNYEDDDVPSGYTSEISGVPTSILFRNGKPVWWCDNAMQLGAMGAHYDDFNGGTLGKLPAQLRYEGIPCE